jgi:hypothetical protein
MNNCILRICQATGVFLQNALRVLKFLLHSRSWFRERNFTFAKKDNPFLLYVFDEKGGTKAIDRSGRNHHLIIPSRMRVLDSEILSPAWNERRINRGLIVDMVIHALGFIPLGFVLTAAMASLGGNYQKDYILAATTLCFVVSLMIEIAQS